MFISLFLGNRRCLLIAVSFIFLLQTSTHTQAQNTSPDLTLHQAITATLAQNPQLHQFAVKKQDLQGQRNTSDLSPPINIGIEVENFGGHDSFSGVNSAETTLALSSVIELGGKRSARVAVVDTRLNLLDYQQQAFTLDVLGELSQSFVLALEVQELIALANEARDLAENTLVIVQNRAQQGAAADSEVKRAMATLAQAQLQVEVLQRRHDRSRIKLAAYWGETAPQWRQLNGDLYAFNPQPSYDDLFQRTKTSPAIEIFASETRLKNAEFQLAKSQSTTEVNWQIGVRHFADTNDSAFIAGMSMPLFTGKRNRGEIASAQAARNAVDFQQQAALLQLNTQLFDAYSQREQHINTATVFRTQIIPNLTSALQTTQRAYESGRYSYQDWIAAQQELINAKRALIESAAAAALNQAVIEQLIAEPLM